MRVAILHNRVESLANADEQDVLVQVDAVSTALTRLGHEPVAMPVDLDLASLVEQLEQCQPDAAFNLVESLGGSDRLMFLPTALLDVIGLPYTGSPTEAIFSSGDKLAAKRRLAEAELPTPEWIVGHSEDDGNGRRSGFCRPASKYILKPIWEHASLGMDNEAVVSVDNLKELARALADRCQQTGRACFAERFIEGREFNLSILASPAGPQVLPPAEIDFSAFSEDELKIVGYDAKWNEDSFAFQNTPRTFDFAEGDTLLLDELAELAAGCWDLFGLRGYARVDFRVDGEGSPWILEVNANPCLSPDAGFAAAVQQAGIGFDQAIERILGDIACSSGQFLGAMGGLSAVATKGWYGDEVGQAAHAFLPGRQPKSR